MGNAQSYRSIESAASRNVQVVRDGPARDNGLVVIDRRNRESRLGIWIRVGDVGGRAEGNDITRLGWRVAVEVAGRIVVRIAVDRRAVVLDCRCAVIQIPSDVVARSRHTVRPSAAIIGRSEFRAQALAPDYISRRIFILHIRGAEAAQIRLARGIDAVIWVRIIELDRDWEIEGVHQTDIVIVAAG